MGYVWQRWLVDELRAAGLTVVPVAGWENRGRPASTGHFDPAGQNTTHHTGTRSSPENPAPSLQTLIHGRSDLPGPLSQLATAYDGTVFVIAAGRANHAGRVGKPNDVPGMPVGSDGNATAIGNEVMTDGTQPLPAAQAHAIATVNAVILRHFGRERDLRYAHRHADISGTGKWDIGQLTTPQLRSLTDRALTDQEERTMPLTPQEVQDIASATAKATVEALLATKISTRNPDGKPGKDWSIETILRNLELEQDRARQDLRGGHTAILTALAELTEAVKGLGTPTQPQEPPFE